MGQRAAGAAGGARAMSELLARLPAVRGKLEPKAAMAPWVWFRVGGPAEVLFKPADVADLQAFLLALPEDVAVLPVGVASNMLIRDGGVPGVVIRLGGVLNRIHTEGEQVIAEAGALDRSVAVAAAQAGIAGLEFFVGIPGTIGGAVRMNAGAFGGETKDRLVRVRAVDRSGTLHEVPAADLGLTYRHSDLPADWIVVEATFQGEAGDPAAIKARMEAIKAERAAAQPLQVATGGSTFKNPAGGRAWQLVDAAGCRGLRHGGAMVDTKHCNFLVNTGNATAADVEALGETVRERVRATSGVELHWEIERVGRP
ncbi:MAG: UDP-N-acetylmuramate dehydrogenase [Geminicoccaceae bacterium]|nr:MAG: UDP-N-acetylmuramate dehydrogenase [Geminicoccaceae bacterium]